MVWWFPPGYFHQVDLVLLLGSFFRIYLVGGGNNYLQEVQADWGYEAGRLRISPTGPLFSQLRWLFFCLGGGERGWEKPKHFGAWRLFVGGENELGVWGVRKEIRLMLWKLRRFCFWPQIEGGCLTLQRNSHRFPTKKSNPWFIFQGEVGGKFPHVVPASENLRAR